MRPVLLAAALAALGACGGQRGKPGSPDIFVNELVASNSHACTDETGGSADWVEVFNASSADLDLQDYVFTDSADPLTDATLRLPSVRVPAKGVKLFWADGRPELGAAHLAFKLNAAEESLLLYGPDGALLDRVDWKDLATDVALARFPDGEGVFVQCAVPTCGALNQGRCLQ